MAGLDTQARVLEEWFRLPESRRRYATDAVAFAFRLLRDQPDLSRRLSHPCHELILSWLMRAMIFPLAKEDRDYGN